MVEPAFLAFAVFLFVVILFFILRSGSSGDSKQGKNQKNQREKAEKPQKAKKGPKRQNPKRLDANPLAFTPYNGTVVNENDAKEILEFIKGKDPNEAAKLYVSQQKQQQQQQQQQQQSKKKKGKKDESERVHESATEKGSDEGFTTIKKEKKPKDNVKNDKPEEQGKPKRKRFYKPGVFDSDTKNQERRGRKGKKEDQQGEQEAPVDGKEGTEGRKEERRKRKEEVDGQSDDQNRPPKKEKRERKEGDKSEEGESSGKEKKRGPPPRRAFTASAPIVKHEENADINDILNSISNSYPQKQAKKTGARYQSVFSTLKRKLIIQIVSKLEAKDLVSLSRVNHYFNNVAREDRLWEALAKRDFGVKETGKYRNFRAAYKGEYKKRRPQKEGTKKEKKNKKEENPKEENKDKKVKKEEKKAEEEETADE